MSEAKVEVGTAITRFHPHYTDGVFAGYISGKVEFVYLTDGVFSQPCIRFRDTYTENLSRMDKLRQKLYDSRILIPNLSYLFFPQLPHLLYSEKSSAHIVEIFRGEYLSGLNFRAFDFYYFSDCLNQVTKSLSKQERSFTIKNDKKQATIELSEHKHITWWKESSQLFTSFNGGFETDEFIKLAQLYGSIFLATPIGQFADYYEAHINPDTEWFVVIKRKSELRDLESLLDLDLPDI